MRRTFNQRGFVLSTEAILILTIMGIGLFVGIIALRDAVFKYQLAKQDTRFIVADSSDPGILIGEVVGFDQHETPLVPFIDYSPNPPNTGVNLRALVGIRDDRFTSRQPIFYTDTACTNNPCIASPGSEFANAPVAGVLNETGSISYLYALQGYTLSYGVGSGTGGAVQGRLYRSSGAACPNTQLQSMWESQRVVSGSPCVNLNTTTPASPVSAADAAAYFDTATEVVDANGDNVLETLTPPFFTNMVSDPSTVFSAVPSDGLEGTP